MALENGFERTDEGEKSDERKGTDIGSVDRRHLLGVVAATGATALAGCTFAIDDDGIEVAFSADDDQNAAVEAGNGPEAGDTDDAAGSGEESGASEGDGDGSVENDAEEREDEATDRVESDELDETETDDVDATYEGEDEADTAPSFSEDCIIVDPTNLTLEEISGGRWRLSSGSSALIVADEKDDAEAAKAIIEHYGFTRNCFVGRPDPAMTYWTR